MAGGLLLFTACEKDAMEISPESMAVTNQSAQSVQDESIDYESRYVVLLNLGSGKTESDYDEMPSALKVQKTKQLVTQLLLDHNVTSSIDALYSESMPGFSAKMTEGEAAMLHQDERIKMMEKDQMVSYSDEGEVTIFSGAGNSNSAYGQLVTDGIEYLGHADATGKTVWVLDSGVDLTHPDLNVDANRSVSYLYGHGNNLSPNDYNGHGTHVAGIIAAKDNGFGVVGVAAGASIVSVRVLDQNGDGHVSRIVAAVDHVSRYGSVGDVANLSFGGGISNILDVYVRVAGMRGIQMVLAAGNDAMDSQYVSPARAQGVNVYTVSAVDEHNRFAYFSNYGTGVDFAAPGVGIISTYMGGRYAVMSGTSMAAPHVSGLFTVGDISFAGFAQNDPDGRPDPILKLK